MTSFRITLAVFALSSCGTSSTVKCVYCGSAAGIFSIDGHVESVTMAIYGSEDFEELLAEKSPDSNSIEIPSETAQYMWVTFGDPRGMTTTWNQPIYVDSRGFHWIDNVQKFEYVPTGTYIFDHRGHRYFAGVYNCTVNQYLEGEFESSYQIFAVEMNVNGSYGLDEGYRVETSDDMIRIGEQDDSVFLYVKGSQIYVSGDSGLTTDEVWFDQSGLFGYSIRDPVDNRNVVSCAPNR